MQQKSSYFNKGSFCGNNLSEFSGLYEAELQEHYDPLSNNNNGCYIDFNVNGKVYKNCFGDSCEFVNEHKNCKFWVVKN